MLMQNPSPEHWPWPRRGHPLKKSTQNHTLPGLPVLPHRHPGLGLVDRWPSAQVSPLQYCRIYRNLCGNQLGGSLNWWHKDRQCSRIAGPILLMVSARPIQSAEATPLRREMKICTLVEYSTTYLLSSPSYICSSSGTVRSIRSLTFWFRGCC